MSLQSHILDDAQVNAMWQVCHPDFMQRGIASIKAAVGLPPQFTRHETTIVAAIPASDVTGCGPTIETALESLLARMDHLLQYSLSSGAH